MPGDPKECRHHAYNCMLLAKQATTAGKRFITSRNPGLGLLPSSSRLKSC